MAILIVYNVLCFFVNYKYRINKQTKEFASRNIFRFWTYANILGFWTYAGDHKEKIIKTHDSFLTQGC